MRELTVPGASSSVQRRVWTTEPTGLCSRICLTVGPKPSTHCGLSKFPSVMMTMIGSTVVLKPSVTVTLYSYLDLRLVERSCLRKNCAFCVSLLVTSNVESSGSSLYVKVPPTPMSPSVTDKVEMTEGVAVFDISKT